ncbi:MAG: hypothetical protein ACTSP4_05960 [Candidatus Hodarchaeales archaeon]
MSQNELRISWKDPANRGAVVSTFGLALIIQSITTLHAIMIYRIGTSINELIFLFVVAFLMGIILAVGVLTGYEYLNERQTEIKYRNISSMGIFVLLIFMIAYIGGFELLKLYAEDLAATPRDIIFLLSEISGVLAVYGVFYAYKFYNVAKESFSI